MSQCLTVTPDQVQEAFLAAPPLISQQIMDLTVRTPSWIRDLPRFTEFPLGNGTVFEQIVMKGEMPAIERGFDKWKLLDNNTGCEPCGPGSCAYNITQFGGTGLQKKQARLMSREFVSPKYCIKEIQTTAHYEQVFAKIVENLYRQTDFFKQENVIFNALTSLTKKYVIDSEGPKPNYENPYVYRNIGTKRISALTIDILEFFYEQLRRMPDAIPYDVINGAPIFSIIASQQTFSRLYRDDPQLRQDVRFSSLANDLLSKYNFMSTIRGMFITAPILFPRRFNVVAGEPVEVLPYVNGIPMDVGSYTGLNPAYEAATHEEVILHGKFPFDIIYQPTNSTLGQNTSFGPEYSWFNNWSWINPLTETDFFRREGFFATSSTIGIAPQYSEGMFAILVERPRTSIMAGWLPAASCPPIDPDCENVVPDGLCPCPNILSVIANPVTAGQYFVTLAVPVDVVANDTIQLGLDNGAYVTATVVAVSSDGKSISVTFANGVDITTCRFTTVFCDNTLGCSSQVLRYNVNCSDNTRLDLVLANPLKADASDSITIYYGDGTSATVTVVSQDFTTNTLVVDVGATAFCDQVNGVVSVCVPTSTDSSCPGCGGVTSTQCET